MDGKGFRFDNEAAGDDYFTVSEIKEQLTLSALRDHRYFGLWRHKRQGLGTQAIHPRDRTYEVPTEEQQKVEIELLRTGLTEE